MTAPVNANLNFGPEVGNGIQALLYVHFVVEKKYRIDECAALMGISTDTLYRYVRGDLTFPAERLAALVQATGDACYLDYLAGRAGYIAVPRPPQRDASPRTIRETELAATVALAKVIEMIEKPRDSGYNTKSIRRIEAAATDVERLMESLKNAVRSNADDEIGGGK